MGCSICGRRELWVLDCDLGVECPSGVVNGCHYHYQCGICGNEETYDYDDDIDAIGQSAYEVLDRARQKVG
jgi:hypothetical protein